MFSAFLRRPRWRYPVICGAVSMDILHFHARVLAVYGQRMFMGNL
jgi:hypothetical protein